LWAADVHICPIGAPLAEVDIGPAQNGGLNLAFLKSPGKPAKVDIAFWPDCSWVGFSELRPFPCLPCPKQPLCHPREGGGSPKIVIASPPAEDGPAAAGRAPRPLLSLSISHSRMPHHYVIAESPLHMLLKNARRAGPGGRARAATRGEDGNSMGPPVFKQTNPFFNPAVSAYPVDG
jgi:hypothetical protein